MRSRQRSTPRNAATFSAVPIGVSLVPSRSIVAQPDDVLPAASAIPVLVSPFSERILATFRLKASNSFTAEKIALWFIHYK